MRVRSEQRRSGSAGHRQPDTETGPLTPPVFDATFRAYTNADLEALVDMYRHFEPKAAFQGLPPRSDLLICEWLDQLLKNHVMFFVVQVGENIVGHAMLYPSRANAAEVAIFVDPNFQGLGIGKRLLLGVLHFACKRLQLAKVWVSVQGANVAALRFFQHLGFNPIDDPGPLWEICLNRPLSCEPCIHHKCEMFGEALPFTYAIASGNRA